MNKTIAQGSLDNLHDIIVPEAIGVFPLAPGWIVLGLLLLALLFHFVVQFYMQYKKSLYKREALLALEQYDKQNQEETVQLLSLAKRVGISAYGREEIAKLSGNSWWDFMEAHSKARVSMEIRETIAKLLYDNTYTLNSNDFTDIKSFVTLWIHTHKGISDV